MKIKWIGYTCVPEYWEEQAVEEGQQTEAHNSLNPPELRQHQWSGKSLQTQIRYVNDASDKGHGRMHEPIQNMYNPREFPEPSDQNR